MTTDNTNEPTVADQYLKDLKEMAEKYNLNKYPYQGTCPNCGYCPHCGKGGWGTYPWYPHIPWTCTSTESK